jgi:hypothetical protein
MDRRATPSPAAHNRIKSAQAIGSCYVIPTSELSPSMKR